MKQKRIILTMLIGYGIVTCFFYVRNVVLAKEKSSYHEIVVKEEINDEDQRATLRAFYSAPPVIPHEIESRGSADCLRCHLNVTQLEDGRVSKKTPHPQMTNCLQCHVPGETNQFDKSSTGWHGEKEPKRGDRWFVTSPPTIPHRVKLRENCLSCHGPQNPDMSLRTPHPERTSCLQCHVPDYRQEFTIQEK